MARPSTGTPTAAGQIFICPPAAVIRRGRPPLNGKRAMTRAEIAARRRAQRQKAEAKPQRPPEELGPVQEYEFAEPLTYLIKRDTFVRRFIDTHFPHLRDISHACNRDLKLNGLRDLKAAYEQPVLARLVGTAIDFRIRAYFDRNVLRAGCVRDGLEKLMLFPEFRKTTPLPGDWEEVETIENLWFRERPERIAIRFVASFGKFVAKIRPERRRLSQANEMRLCRYCVLFAYLDWIGRAPLTTFAMEMMVLYGDRSIERMLGYLDNKVVSDVAALSSGFQDQFSALISTFRRATIGGTLAGSEEVGGADFDLLVDGCLFDFKATSKAKITTDNLRQLVGYWLLDYEDVLAIRSVAVTLLRHNSTRHFDIVSDLLGDAISPNHLRLAFRKGLLERKAKWLAKFGAERFAIAYVGRRRRDDLL